MRALVLRGICNLSENRTPLELVELPDPVPRDNEILVRVTACGVCHTELDEIEGRTPPPQFPVVLECSRKKLLAGRALCDVAASRGRQKLPDKKRHHRRGISDPGRNADRRRPRSGSRSFCGHGKRHRRGNAGGAAGLQLTVAEASRVADFIEGRIPGCRRKAYCVH